MFDYSVKAKAISISLLVVLLIALVYLINYNNSRARDLEMVAQARTLATGMEKYFAKNYSYPELAKMKLSKVKVVTENGINQNGDYLYFQAPDWVMDGTVQSTPNRYLIEFDLNHSWELWGLSDFGGGTCRLSNNLKIVCANK